jgi:hypothetical protein
MTGRRFLTISVYLEASAGRETVAGNGRRERKYRELLVTLPLGEWSRISHIPRS